MNLDKKMIKNNIPRIRFSNFEAFWVEKRIADIVKISAGGDVDKERLKESGKYPVIANALTNKGIVGFYDDYKVKAPAVTVTGRGDVGYALARHENFTPVVRLLTLQSDSIDVDYLENQINSMKILNESTGVPQLTAPQLGNYKVYLPEIDEQSTIGSLFCTLDDLLASYKDNLANYQSLKATMLSKMFPKAGQTVPEIRLDGFEGEWEIRKLNEVSEVYDGTHQTPNYTESGVKFLSVENISTLESEKYISEEDFEKDFKVFPEFGDVLMTRIGSIGVPNIVKTNEKIAFYVSLALLKPKKKTNSLFMKSSIESNPFQEELWKKTLHIAFPKKINKNDISQSIIKCPSYEEQQAIGSYFSNLDNLINSHQEKISQLETLKKKLLQDMFI